MLVNNDSGVKTNSIKLQIEFSSGTIQILKNLLQVTKKLRRGKEVVMKLVGSVKPDIWRGKQVIEIGERILTVGSLNTSGVYG